MAGTASCVMAMGHIVRSRPGRACRGPRAKVRDRGEVGAEEKIRFTSSILPKWARRTKSLDALLPVLYLRGVSTGDFQEALTALLGKDAPNPSPAVITRLTAEWQTDYDAWRKRDLSARRYVYVWADGCRPGWKRPPNVCWR
jgi:putative transposase